MKETIKTEFLKQKKVLILVCILMPLFINTLLYFTLDFRYWDYLIWKQEGWELSNWQLVFQDQCIFYFSEICHVFAAALVYQSFAVEKEGNAWMLVMSLPYRKKAIIGKYAVCLFGMLVFLLTDLITVAIDGFIIGVQGTFETGLFVRVFLAQFCTSALMIAFFFFLATVSRKIVWLIPASIVIAFLAFSLYYQEGEWGFLPLYPFTYGVHGFLASNSEIAVMVPVALALSILFLSISLLMVKRKEVLE